MGWQAQLPYQNAMVTTEMFTQLLGNTWLDNELINSMMEQLSMALKGYPSKDNMMIGTLKFRKKILPNGLRGIYNRKKGAGTICHYEKAIKEQDLQILLFPWLELQFKVHFEIKGNTIPHRKQKDTINCGPTAVNMVEHSIFGVKLWAITPLIVAALPISNDMDAVALAGLLQTILDGFISHGRWNVQYSAFLL
ncbi:hypothetical protein CPB84DRAFT_1744921 [Gymnopilus junonius]|uniref:Uncharacterized protein n=1 Tax=Gymnopilus junonius TaxID=109634 RepID=A0A9P5NVM3_GYMJU|nr:hypothetical protein CPB84DRAFT_1744921 [Gymnopilus junonius]